jgi:hypothetical protein
MKNRPEAQLNPAKKLPKPRENQIQKPKLNLREAGKLKQTQRKLETHQKKQYLQNSINLN